MPATADKDLAEAITSELQIIRATEGDETGALAPLKSLLAIVSPTGGTGIMSTALQAPAARAATHLAIQKLVVAIEQGWRSEVDGLWQSALTAAHTWHRALHSTA